MTHPVRRLAAVIVSCALLGPLSSAPSLSAQTPPGPVPGSVSGAGTDRLVSDDGRLTLTLPLGVDAAGLSVVRVAVSAPATVAYELRPVDSSFPVPVMASWQLDPAALPATDGDLVWLGMARADDATSGPWSWLDDSHVTLADGDYRVTGALSQFGTLVVAPLPTLIHGPTAAWGQGYSPGRGVEVPLELTLVERVGASSAATFNGDWRFGGGYPGVIDVTTTAAADGSPRGCLAVPADRGDVTLDYVRCPAGPDRP